MAAFDAEARQQFRSQSERFTLAYRAIPDPALQEVMHRVRDLDSRCDELTFRTGGPLSERAEALVPLLRDYADAIVDLARAGDAYVFGETLTGK